MQCCPRIRERDKPRHTPSRLFHLLLFQSFNAPSSIPIGKSAFYLRWQVYTGNAFISRPHHTLPGPSEACPGQSRGRFRLLLLLRSWNFFLRRSMSGCCGFARLKKNEDFFFEKNPDSFVSKEGLLILPPSLFVRQTSCLPPFSSGKWEVVYHPPGIHGRGAGRTFSRQKHAFPQTNTDTHFPSDTKSFRCRFRGDPPPPPLPPLNTNRRRKKTFPPHFD